MGFRVGVPGRRWRSGDPRRRWLPPTTLEWKGEGEAQAIQGREGSVEGAHRRGRLATTLCQRRIGGQRGGGVEELSVSSSMKKGGARKMGWWQ
jgi:hypothetical protein